MSSFVQGGRSVRFLPLNLEANDLAVGQDQLGDGHDVHHFDARRKAPRRSLLRGQLLPRATDPLRKILVYNRWRPEACLSFDLRKAEPQTTTGSGDAAVDELRLWTRPASAEQHLGPKSSQVPFDVPTANVENGAVAVCSFPAAPCDVLPAPVVTL